MAEENKVSHIDIIRKMLKLENSFYVNFQLKDIKDLSIGIHRGKGFFLNYIYEHPTKKDFFVLEIKTKSQDNYGLDFRILRTKFSVNNEKRVSPNLRNKPPLTINEFECKYKVNLSRPMGV